MLRHLSRSFTAGALAITLALTGITATASPAAANNHRNNGGEAAAVLGGLLLLYGLSQAGRNNGDRRQPQVIQPHRPHNPQPQFHPQPRFQPQPQFQPVHRVAPQHCFVQGHDGNGQYRGYRYRCMQNHAAQAHFLPSNCLRHVWTDRGQRTIYSARCLSNHGWTFG
ncbi:hypothetical protein [Jannaschia sp. CCS1]|uniref:hypothetical protein n=1 Tax=Jannaschia sp. (strain CCS1) TaxID=290400 RepID=UPI000053A3F6|nr:hypothetical protein [Jannaschia sp. CCS1]ABD53307.1 hypothetical protein Jann_0390 [Jannaschia sp. CCS1]